jgi:membrane protein implicated in regulation of membrane protease activity
MLLYLSFNIYSILTEIFFLFGIIVLLLFGVITTTNVNLGYPLLNKSIQFLVFQILSFGLILLANQSPIYLLT